jgi:hypothetical protein
VVEPHLGASSSGASVDGPSALTSTAALASTAVLASTAALASTGAASVSTALMAFDEQARNMKNGASSAAVVSTRTIGFFLPKRRAADRCLARQPPHRRASLALDPFR